MSDEAFIRSLIGTKQDKGMPRLFDWLKEQKASGVAYEEIRTTDYEDYQRQVKLGFDHPTFIMHESENPYHLKCAIFTPNLKGDYIELGS